MVNTIWSKNNKNKAALVSDFLSFEKNNKLVLPSYLKKMYTLCNGGHLNKNLTNRESCIYLDGLLKIENFISLKEIGDSIDFGLEEENWNLTINNTAQLIVIARLGFSSFTCLDYRGVKTPKVAIFNTANMPELVEEYPSFKISLQVPPKKIDTDSKIDQPPEINKKLLLPNQKNIKLVINQIKTLFDISRISKPILDEGIKNAFAEVEGDSSTDHIYNLAIISIGKCAALIHHKKD